MEISAEKTKLMTTPTASTKRLSIWTEARDSRKLQVPGLSCIWRGFQAWDTLQDSTDDSSIDMVETSLEWQERFSQFQDMTNALPCHIHLPVCLRIMDTHSSAAKKNTSCGNEVLPQDTTYLIQRPCYHQGSLCQDPEGNWTTWRPLDHRKEICHQVWPKPSRKAQWKGEEDNANKRRGGKTTSGNGHAWSLPGPRRQWRTEQNGGNWLWSHLCCPNNLRG